MKDAGLLATTMWNVSLLSYSMEAVLDSGSTHIHALARLLVTLNKPSLIVPLLTSLIPKDRLLAYQFASDLS